MKHKISLLVIAFLSIVSVTKAQTLNMSDRNITYTLNNTDNTASITGNTILLPVTLVIPDTIRYKSVLYKVTSIAANAFKDNNNITGKLTILTTGLKSIGNSAFSGCAGLKDTLSLPNTLTSIGTSAFAGCNMLTLISVPSGLTSISASTFQSCTKVSKVIIPTTVTTIGDYAFEGCTGLTDTVAISSAVTSIGVSSFRTCNIGVKVDPNNTVYSSSKGVLYNKTYTTLIQAPINIAGIDTIQSSVTSIGTYAFYKCTALTGLVLPNSLTTVGKFAFSGCNKIATTLIVPASVTSIGNYAFQGCSKLSSVVVPTIRVFAGSFDAAAVKFTLTGTIDARDFKFLRDSTSMTTLDLGSATIAGYTGTGGTNNCAYGLSTAPAAVSAVFAANTIPQFAFSYANTLSTVTSAYPILTITGKTSLKSIVFPAAVITIDKYAFGSCTGIVGVFNIPSPIKTIGNGAFIDCGAVTDFTLPSTLTAIGDNAFERCIGLNQPLSLPSSLLSIGSYSYSACKNIPGNIILPEGFTTIGTYAFQSCRKITNIIFPTTLKTIAAGVCSSCDLLSSFTIPETVTSLGANAFEYCPKLTNVTLPSTLTTLGGYAFYQCVGLSNIKLPAELAKIDTYTFYYCTNLKNVTLPTALTTLGDYAFYNCTSLNDMTMPVSLKTIGQYTFACCPKLTSVTLPDLVTALPNYSFAGCTGLTNVTLPANTASIGTYTFQNCSALKTVNLPAALKTIGEAAFTNCTALSSVTIPATVTTIGNYTFSNCSAPLFVDAANTVYASVDSVLFNKALTTLIQCPISKTGNYTIPSTVTTLGDYSFYFCSKLKSIYIPASVATIGDKVFYNCTGLRSIISASAAPINLSSVENVFGNIDPACVLYVPYGAKAQYQLAGQWNEISKVVEATTAVENPTDAKFTAHVVNGQLLVSNVEIGKTIDIYTLVGTFVSRTVATSDVTTLNLSAKGIYVVKIGSQSVKIIND